MGWRIILKTDKPIIESDIDEIVEDLPRDLEGFGNRQSWGWSCATDIMKPEGKEIRISGSYSQSGKLARPMAERLISELTRLGYVVESDIEGDLGL